MGDFEEVERLQAGIRDWLLRTSRNGRHELRDIQAPAVLPLLCAAAFGSALATAGDLASSSAVARIGVLSSVDAGALSDVLRDALERARSAHSSADPSRYDLQREIGLRLKEILVSRDGQADEVRSDIAMVLQEIDAGGTVFRASIESGSEELQREVLAAVEAVSAEWGEMAFMLADLARAAGEIQDGLRGQGSDLRATSEQVGRQSADVRMIREELAVIERRTGGWVPAPDGQPPARWAGRCPYRGLLPYDQAHEAVFYGRERLTAELTGMLAETGMVMVTGASGAGKTSLLQAGLIPALARGVQVPGSSRWPVVSMTPTAHPLTELSVRLAQLDGRDPAPIRQGLADTPGNADLLISEITRAAASPEHDGAPGQALPGEAGRLVLIVDQFEQVFADASEAGRLERAAFIDAVCAAAASPTGPRGESPALVVLAVRGDYWDRCAAYPQLVRIMQQNQLVVGPLTDTALRRVITGPAEASGLRVEPGLTDVILADLRGAGSEQNAGVLPLLSEAMVRAWEKREDGQLTRQGYEGDDRRAGVARAIEVSAEATYGQLTQSRQAMARALFRALTAPDPDLRPARRTVTRAALRSAFPASERPDVDVVLEAFARGRLIVLDGDRAGIAHDVVLQAWPRLRGWLEEDQASVILHAQLVDDAARWNANGKDAALLYRGAQLAAAGQATRAREADPGRFPALSPAESEFLRVSDWAMGRSRWRRRILAGVLALVVIAALVAAGVAAHEARTTAGQQNAVATSQRLAQQSTALEAADPATAALLAAAAWRIAPTAQARYSLLESLAQPVRGILTAQSGVVTALAYGPGGRSLAAGYQDGTIRLWDVASHRLIGTASLGAVPLALAFTASGTTLEVAASDAVGSWDLTNQAHITLLPLAGPTNAGSIAFSPDAKTIATGGRDGIIRLWDTESQQEIGTPMSSDASGVDAVAFSPDGTTLATANTDGNVQLWNTATQQVTGPALTGAGSAQVNALAFSPDGTVLATGSQDGTTRLWEVATASQVGVTMATGYPVSALAFGDGGTTLATAENDGSTELWNVATQTQTGAALTAPGAASVSALAFSPGASALATGGGNGTISLWDPATFYQSSAPLVIDSQYLAAAGRASAVLSADGGVLATVGSRGTVRLWDVTAKRPLGVPLANQNAVTAIALSPDGRTLAVAGDDVRLFTTATGAPIGTGLPVSGGNGTYSGLAFSPGGTLLATVGADGTARLWNVATQQQVGSPMTIGRPGTSSGTIAFSPDGTTLATVGAGGQTQLWSVVTHRPVGKPMAAGAATTVLAFSRDGRTLATAGTDGSVRLWDVATQQEIGAPLTADTQPVYAAAFSPDGRTLATAGADGFARLWDVAFPPGLVQAACGIADASLTRQQWAGYAGTQPFQQVCPAS
ncbi:MAG TPA: AAA family ATPase [Streptosporangiaceae bacterium]|nr:AAA family ATPase [Streptosporangiaceae bacterium]